MARIYRLSLVFITIILGIVTIGTGYAAAKNASAIIQTGPYKVIAWNDLGMHCYNRDFQDIAVLPPYNTLRAQVIKVGNPPQIITTGITVSYAFADNTYSIGKSNFWSYANALFGVPLAPDVGLTGHGLAGQMAITGNMFEVTGIPLTEFSDSAPTTPNPYQLATIIVRNQASGAELARVEAVAPVSTEMHCDNCHDDYGRASPNIATGRVGTNILTFHDREQGTHLMGARPVLCANCHASNALGKPGRAGLPSLSNAMHEKHAGEVPNTMAGCYNCHPGPNTKCLRDIMSTRGMTCINCHGTMENVAQNTNPWLNEPRCDNAACHGSGFAQDQALYRMSTGHGGMSCEACHDSTHAIARSTQPNDELKFLAFQGMPGPIFRCTSCHATMPANGGPHGFSFHGLFMPFLAR